MGRHGAKRSDVGDVPGKNPGAMIATDCDVSGQQVPQTNSKVLNLRK